jgi:hypothetical protein
MISAAKISEILVLPYHVSCQWLKIMISGRKELLTACVDHNIDFDFNFNLYLAVAFLNIQLDLYGLLNFGSVIASIAAITATAAVAAFAAVIAAIAAVAVARLAAFVRTDVLRAASEGVGLFGKASKVVLRGVVRVVVAVDVVDINLGGYRNDLGLENFRETRVT